MNNERKQHFRALIRKYRKALVEETIEEEDVEAQNLISRWKEYLIEHDNNLMEKGILHNLEQLKR